MYHACCVQDLDLEQVSSIVYMHACLRQLTPDRAAVLITEIQRLLATNLYSRQGLCRTAWALTVGEVMQRFTFCTDTSSQ